MKKNFSEPTILLKYFADELMLISGVEESDEYTPWVKPEP